MNREQRRSAARGKGKVGNPSGLDLASYIGGYKTGYEEGYFRCLADAESKTTVDTVATQILAVMHDPHELATYVLRMFKRAVMPRNLEAFAHGIDRAVAHHLQQKGLLPETEPPKAEEAIGAE